MKTCSFTGDWDENRKKIHRALEFNQTQWLNPQIEFNTQERIEAEKNEHRDGKALYILMNKLWRNYEKFEKYN